MTNELQLEGDNPFSDMALHHRLSANVVGFCRLLRHQGSGVGPGEERDALQALQHIDLSDSAAFCAALRVTLAKSAEEQKMFDAHFASYWQVWDRATELNRRRRDDEETTAVVVDKRTPARAATVTISDWLKGGEKAEEEGEAAGYSSFEVITQRDFSGFDGAEVNELIELINALARSLASRFSRRYRHSKRRGKLDLRRTLRANLRRGGDIVELVYRRRRRQRLKLVLLCDVSKSMDLYSRFLIQFIYAFQSVYRRIETFVFSTSLHRITDTLKAAELPQVLDQLADVVPDWSGGTRIGASLQTFLQDYGAHSVDRNTVVLIASDGWDTGDIEVLEESMDELQHRARCVIWMNPLMGNSDYQPSCRGMQAALPFVDIFAPAHNLDSLKRLVHQLAKVQDWTAPRRGRAHSKRSTAASATSATDTPIGDSPSYPELERWRRRFGL